jgi:ElaB/YqjD/DUF883 family membrane-anchored ribosome-binding protein
MVTTETTHLLPPATDSGLRHKVENLRSRGVAAVQSAQRSLSTRVTTTRTKTEDSMRTNPMLWAGIAGGTGFALGLIGRIVHWRTHRPVPTLVVIETSC